jgi:hypothetical protein
MEPTYNLYPLEFADISAEEPAVNNKICPGLQQFCPHYMSEVCDVKYSECVLLNSLKTSETLLRMERENLMKHPTPQSLDLIRQINVLLREDTGTTVDPAAILRNKRKGRVIALLFFLISVIVAMIMYLGS